MCKANLSCLSREEAMLTSAYSPVQEIQLLADQGLDVHSVPAAGGPLEGAVGGERCPTRGGSQSRWLTALRPPGPPESIFSSALITWSSGAETSLSESWLHHPEVFTWSLLVPFVLLWQNS